MKASGIEPGDAAGDPKRAVRRMGDPVLAVSAGLARGALETGTAVTFAGGTQMLTVVALLRHAGIERRLPLATTSFVVDDETAGVERLADDLTVDLTATDPGFDGRDHPAFDAYARGEAKEGVGMGGALALSERAGVPMATVRDSIRSVYERIVS
jgi:NaMN:DMB phosphoribosyltransferase